MWEYVAILKQNQVDCQDYYSIKHTEVGEYNSKIVNISLTLSPETMNHQMVHTHLNNKIWYLREDSTVWRTKIWGFRHYGIWQLDWENIKKG